MGIIKQQSLQSTIYIYLGIGIGFLNTAVLMPLLLTTEQVGMLSFLNSFTNLFATLLTLGIPLIVIRTFPSLDEFRQKYFLGFVILATLIGAALGVGIYMIFSDYWLTDKNAASSFQPFFYAFIVVFVLKLIFKNLDAYIRMLLNTVLGAFLENFLLKSGIFLCLVAFWLLQGFDFLYLFLGYGLALALPGIVSFLYLGFKGRVSPKIFIPKNFGSSLNSGLIQVGLFGFLGTVGNIIVLEIDRYMISNMISLSANGIYTVTFFFGVFVNAPSRGIKRIATVIISDAWKNNDLDTISDIYSKSCLNQFLICSYLFLGIWLNVDFVLQHLPVDYALGRNVILIIGLAQLIDMLTGVNAEVIATSKHYRVNTYFVITLMVLVAGLNYILIPIYGIDGAAYASGIAMLLVNVARYLFLYKVLNFQPFDFKFLLIILIALTNYFVLEYLNDHIVNPIIGILTVGATLTLSYWIPAYLLKISESINDTIKEFSSKIGISL